MCCCNCNYCITTYSFEYVSVVVLLEIESIEILWAKPGKKRGIFLDVLSELNMVLVFFDGTSKNFCTEFLWMLYDLTVASMKNKDK